MIEQEEYLITINSKNKIQKVLIQLDKNPYLDNYFIRRITGQFDGKDVDQPLITVESGKVKRSVKEQAELMYNSLIKKYLDKGYVKLASLTDKKYTECTAEELKKLLGGGFISDQKGIPKPMLAKLADNCSADIWEKDWECSRKLDGVRCLMYYRDGIIQTASRGGDNYNVATTHLRNDPNLLEIFHQEPDLILDGEIYIHSSDWPLQRISGTCRLKERTPDCDELEYWIYDYISDQPFKDRKAVLEFMSKLFPKDSKIKFVKHTKLKSYLTIKKEHDKYVQEGFEGLCARNPEREYGVNKRSAVYLVKLKERKDDEALIVDVKEGMRPEDMCFILRTKDGKEFAAKPIGDIDTRLNYLKNSDKYIGMYGTYTYFTLSKDGVPQQPVFKAVRYKEDLPDETL